MLKYAQNAHKPMFLYSKAYLMGTLLSIGTPRLTGESGLCIALDDFPEEYARDHESDATLGRIRTLHRVHVATAAITRRCESGDYRLG